MDEIKRPARIQRLVANLYAAPPEIESARALLLTESYKETERLPLGAPRLSRRYLKRFLLLSARTS